MICEYHQADARAVEEVIQSCHNDVVRKDLFKILKRIRTPCVHDPIIGFKRSDISTALERVLCMEMHTDTEKFLLG